MDISDWTNDNSAHADHHLIAVSPGFNGTTNKTVYFGNDGGIYRTADVYTVGSDIDRTQGWENLNNGYAVTQFYGAAGNSAGVIVAGSQDNGTVRYLPNDETLPWKFIFGGDGGFCAADPHDENLLYGEYVFGDVHRNSDKGATALDPISGEFWDGDHVCWKASPFSINDAQKHRALFIAPFLLDPNDDNRLYVGCRSLWRTQNAKAPVDAQSGPAWASIKEPISERDDISAIAIPPGEPDVIWIAYSHGRIFKTTNGLKEIPDWVESRAPGTRRPRRYWHRLTIDPRNHNIIYATFGGYHVGNIWKLDGSGRWTLLNDPLPEKPVPVRDLVVHPARSDYLYIATEVGVFASEDSGKTWSPTNEGPTSCRVDQLFWMSQKLIAVTFGRGIFEIDLSKIAPAP